MPQETASQQINQDEINAILWKACNTFRGTEFNFRLVLYWHKVHHSQRDVFNS